MHFARGFKRLFQPFNAAISTTTTTTIGELYCHPQHFTLSFISSFCSFVYLSLLPLFCMLFSLSHPPYAFRRWLSAFYAAFSSLFLLKPDYFNCVHCLLFIFFLAFFSFVRLLVYARLNWSVGGDSTDVLLNSLKFNTSQVIHFCHQLDTKYNKTLSYYLKSVVLESHFSALIN